MVTDYLLYMNISYAEQNLLSMQHENKINSNSNFSKICR